MGRRRSLSLFESANTVVHRTAAVTNLAKPKSYLRRIWSQAAADTRRFWKPYHVITAIAFSVVVTAIVWAAIRGWSSWRDMHYAPLLAILIFLSGWGIVFVVAFFLAPAGLDAQSQRTIADLSQQLEMPDKAVADHLRQLLAGLGNNGREALKFILHYDEVSRRQVKLGLLSWEETTKAIDECLDAGLIECRHQIFAGAYFAFYWVPESFRPALKRILLPHGQTYLTAAVYRDSKSLLDA
jgi:hypothetical protein